MSESEVYRRQIMMSKVTALNVLKTTALTLRHAGTFSTVVYIRLEISTVQNVDHRR